MNIDIPLNRLVCISGPSGSGKTSLLHAAFAACDKTPTAWQGRRKMISRKGQDFLRRPYFITMEPIGKNSLSTPATYINVFNHIREKFAEAKKRGVSKSFFSFSNRESRCPNCQGAGFVTNDSFQTCPKCGGSRYKDNVLALKYKGLRIADVNRLTVDKALSVFHDVAGIKRRLEFLKNVALGYLVLGQPSNSLSGGEAQRIKIAVNLTKKLGDKCVYIIDGPSAGLDNGNIPRILESLWNLVDKNNTVMIAENNPDIFLKSDWLIILGNPLRKGSQRKMNTLFSGNPKNCPSDLLKRLEILS